MSKRRPGSTLTDKEKMFCEEYIIDLDATQAAIRAGYSENSAASTASHVKQRPEVEEYIDQLLENRSLRLRITADDVLLELAKIAFAEVVDVVKGGEEKKEPETENAPSPGNEKMLQYLRKQDEAETPNEDKCTPASVCRIVYTNRLTGRKTTLHFSINAKIAALKLLGKHLGLFDKNREDEQMAPIIITPGPDTRQVQMTIDNKAA